MKKIKLIIGIIILISTYSCVTNKILTSSVQPNTINNMGYFEPISYIHLVEKGNKSKLNDSLSKLTKTKIENILLTNMNKFHISDSIKFENDSLKKKFENEILYLTMIIDQKRTLKDITIPPTTDSILKINNKRYGLAIIIAGFERRKGNYGGQVAKGIGVGILTLGMYTPVPIKAKLKIYGIIFDSKLKNIAFYRSNIIEKSPTDSIILKKQLTRLFEGYFYTKRTDQ